MNKSRELVGFLAKLNFADVINPRIPSLPITKSIKSIYGDIDKDLLQRHNYVVSVR